MVLFLYSMGHNSEIYENPMEFYPERFAIDHRVRRNPFDFIPFSAGPRNCIGKRSCSGKFNSKIE